MCFFRFFSLRGFYKILSKVPCAILQVLVSYLFYIWSGVYVNPNLLIHPSSHPPFPFGNPKFVFHVCESLLFWKHVHLYLSFFFFKIPRISGKTFVFLWLSSLSMIISFQSLYYFEKKFLVFILFIFLPHHEASGILVPRPGFEPRSLNCWMARKFPFYYFSCTYLIDLVRLLVDSSEQQQMQKIILSFPWFCGNTIFASVDIVFIEWSQQLSFHLVYLVVVQSLSHVQLFCNPMDCSLPGSSIHRIMLVSGIQPSNSCILMYTCVYIYIYTHTLCQVLFHDRLLQSIKQSSQARILEWVAISFSMEFS